VEKLVTFFTSRDPAVSDTLVKAATSVARHTDFGASFERHAAAWEELWRVCDVRVSGEDSVQLLLRLHIGHVLQVCSRNTADLDAGLPARGLNGEGGSRSVRAAVRDDVRKLSVGDRTVFELSRNHATTPPSQFLRPVAPD
jgi:hypothetical protein